ncbi:DUF2254 domain-containing protein [Ascidiimonas sp. W6]|uniref:DUF2254 domain-containing protein n=1 Tax=Ascidiimonas meishanensis TaxID=3128903 RepID=UPI0030ED4714
MKIIIKLLKKVYRRITRSIAFYPVLISFLFLIIGLFVLYIERTTFLIELKHQIPDLVIQDKDAAHSLLSVLIGGVISLTVFSFTMVMVVLNQASSNFSPRLLPGLISNKKHQVILGVYTGTIIYSLFLLTVLGTYTAQVSELAISIILSAISGMSCIALFVYFIHSISSDIQIHNIIRRIFNVAQTKIDQELKKQNSSVEALEVEKENKFRIRTNKTGYYKSFDINLLSAELKSKLKVIEIIPYPECYIWQGDTIAFTDVDLSYDEKEELLFSFHIASERQDGEGYLEELIKLMEIAVKALSPGINDPGTAKNAIVKLGQLTSILLTLKPKMAHTIEGKLSVIRQNVTSDVLINTVFQPIRNYGKNDFTAITELLNCYRYLLNNENISASNKNYIRLEVKALKEDVSNNISNHIDKYYLMSSIEDVQSIKNY